MFLTVTVNGIRWSKLLKVRYDLRDLSKTRKWTITEGFNSAIRGRTNTRLRQQDILRFQPNVKCYRIDKYCILPYFSRMEPSHRGSPHAHIPLRFKDKPRQAVRDSQVSYESVFGELHRFTERSLHQPNPQTRGEVFEAMQVNVPLQRPDLNNEWDQSLVSPVDGRWNTANKSD